MKESQPIGHAELFSLACSPGLLDAGTEGTPDVPEHQPKRQKSLSLIYPTKLYFPLRMAFNSLWQLQFLTFPCEDKALVFP